MLVEKAAPDALLPAIAQFRATVCFTAPTSYRAMARGRAAQHDIASLRKCVSAGEALPAATRALWKQATGIEIIDGIGSTELLHIFISADEAHARPGATGVPVPGYRACVLGDDGQELPRGQVGRLAVKGPTGCKYLDDPRQANYVQNGWNLTGDAYLRRRRRPVRLPGAHRRHDHLRRLQHRRPRGGRARCCCTRRWPNAASIGVPDEARGRSSRPSSCCDRASRATPRWCKTLQDFAKQTIAPYKYPRQIEFRASLPRTETGKLQRFRLREPA